MQTLKVSSKSQASAVAGAIAGLLREGQSVELQAVGAGAVNQAVKAIAIASGYVAPHGMRLTFVPAFVDLTIDGAERTGIKLIIATH